MPAFTIGISSVGSSATLGGSDDIVDGLLPTVGINIDLDPRRSATHSIDLSQGHAATHSIGIDPRKGAAQYSVSFRQNRR